MAPKGRTINEVQFKLDAALELMRRDPNPQTIGFVEGLRRVLAVLEDCEREAKRIQGFCAVRRDAYNEALFWGLGET